MRRAVIGWALAALALCGASAAREEVPAPEGRISDFAHVIGDADRARMEQAILDLERRTGAQIGVVTVRSLGGAPIEDFAVRVFEKWGVGHEGRDDGVLVVLALAEGAVRIEVGYGLEGVLPDGLCGEINRDTMIPKFEQGDFAGGLAAGVERIAQIVAAGEPAASPSQRGDARPGRPWVVWLAGLAVLLVLVAVARRFIRR